MTPARDPWSPELSIAVPAYNEVDTLPELYRRIEQMAAGIGVDWELVVADDGSTDGTRTLLRELSERDPRVRAVFLSRNFGHTSAYLAALEHATGDWRVVMDSDLQDEPEVIPALLETARQGYDVVYVTKGKRTEGFLLRAAFNGYYRLAGKLSSVPQPPHAGPFCIMSRRAATEISRLRERNIFFPGARSYVGFRQTGISADRPARAAGRSRIRMSRRIAGALDGILAFSHVPLRLAAWMGVLVAALAGLLGLMFVYLKIFTRVEVQGFTALITALLFLGGVQLLCLGVIGAYLGRVYDEVKNRPRYHVEEWLNVEDPGLEPGASSYSVRRDEPDGR